MVAVQCRIDKRTAKIAGIEAAAPIPVVIIAIVIISVATVSVTADNVININISYNCIIVVINDSVV